MKKHKHTSESLFEGYGGALRFSNPAGQLRLGSVTTAPELGAWVLRGFVAGPAWDPVRVGTPNRN